MADSLPADVALKRQAIVDAQLQAGELAPWKAALGRAWLNSPQGQLQAVPSAADIQALLLDSATLATLRQVEGPWDVLVAQARSMQVHGQMGDALAALLELQQR